MKHLYLLILFTFASTPAFACNNPEILKVIQKVEQEKLLDNAPTFKHAWDDQKIILTFSNSQSKGDFCIANMTVELPKEDIEQVNQYLEANPAKRILLAAQGYAVPNESTTVEYLFQPDGSDFNESNQALSQLHNNIEFTYQTLAQERAIIPDNASNKTPWSKNTIQTEIANCESLATKQNQSNKHCNCRVEKLSDLLSQRQMELVHFINSQPFATATGVLNNFNKISNNINNICKAL
jgi:hypothetical protein